MTETDCSFYLFSLWMEIYLDEDRPCAATFEGVHLSWRQKKCEWEKKTLSGEHGKLYMLLPLTEVRGFAIFINLFFLCDRLSLPLRITWIWEVKTIFILDILAASLTMYSQSQDFEMRRMKNTGIKKQDCIELQANIS